MFTDVVPPCAAEPAMWDLDQGSVQDWLCAVAICGRCPLLVACGEALAGLPERPVGVIWAGIPFGKRGLPMTLTAGGQLRSVRGAA